MLDRVLESNFSSSRKDTDSIVGGVRVNGIIDLFENLGYECETNTRLTGMSGARHQFDIVARRDTELVVIDVISLRASILDTPASDDEVAEQISMGALRMRVKGWDCGAYQKMIIHLSSYFSTDDNDSGASQHDPFEQFLKDFDIKVIRAADIQSAGKKIQTMLNAVELA
ncbi:MAG: hypothetical protein M1587_05890 [Thaumarchaeota archaeon]|nr:hypothetical protein [Nitrososphaerota archaeon]MDG6906213.1 hypothetical protein [Nitrososphaerota archaeon]